MTPYGKSLALAVGGALPICLAACGRSTAPEPPPPPPPPAEASPAPAAVEPAPAPGTPPAAPASKVVRFADGFKTPESVLYDAERDRYLVSNINGRPVDADDNGFISQLAPEGKVVELKWIDGEKQEVTLNAPKGLALASDKLYVSDLDTVRAFDARSGAPAGEVKIQGATFLNDVSAGPDGMIYVSDSGLKLGDKGFEPTGTDAVYKVDFKAKKATPLLKSKDLNRPNGIVATEQGVWCVTFAAKELSLITPKGKRESVHELPKAMLDGLVLLPGGEFLVSSWEDGAVYRGPAAGPFRAVVTGVTSPADIGFDTKRNRVLIPLFQKDAVEAHPLD